MARAKGLSTADLKLWAAYSQTLSRLMPAGALSPVHNYPSALFFAQQNHRVDRESVPGRDPGSDQA